MADKNHEKTREKVRNEVSLDRNHERSRHTAEDKHGKKSKRKTEKTKSRKRSHSESDTDSSSSTSSSDSDQRKKRKKNHEKKLTSSESSSSDSDDKHCKSKHKRKKKQRKGSGSSSSSSDEKKSKFKHKQKKKQLKKKSKLKKKAKHRGVVDQNKYGAYGILRESDMFVKQQEFYCWLQEVKNVNSETLPKYETRKLFEDYMEDYNTATLPHKKYYDLEKWEAKRQRKNELKVLKKARETSFSIADDEKRHELLHRRVDSNKYAGPSRQQLLEMQQELRRRQDEEYKKKAGIA